MILKTQSLLIGYHTAKGPLLPAINIQVDGAAFIALAGVNGAGKSTFLKTITGLIPALGGRVELNGRRLEELPQHEIALLVSVVLTEFPDDLFLRVEDVVAMGRYPYSGFWGRLGLADKQKVQWSMEVCNIAHLAGRRIVSLSDGEKQKTFIAKAIAQDTPLIILDEPAAFLDYPGKLELMVLLRKLVAEQGKTVVFSSHDLDLVLRHADRLWLLAPDKAFVDGSPEMLATNGYIAEFFNRRSVEFNIETGSFAHKVQPSRKVQIVGEIPNLKWIHNALERNGFATTTEKSRFSISYSDSEYRLRCDETTYFCADIDSLILNLKQYES